MEVAARGSGDPLTPRSSGAEEGSSGSRVNVILTAAIAVCLAAVIVLGFLMNKTYESRADAVEDDGLWAQAGSVLGIERRDPAESTRAGEVIGEDTVEALEPAPAAEQQRTADQLEAASRMANAFLNLRHDEIEANIEAVKSLATGPFLRQYTSASADLATLIRRAEATQTGEVVWTALIAGDDDDATVIVATNGTVANKVTDFEPEARTYRLQLDLDLVDGRWLTSDLQYVR